MIVIDSDLPLQADVRTAQQAVKSSVHSRSLVDGGNLHDTVGINFESDFDLRDTTRCRGNARELELPEEIVILGKLTFALEDLD